MTLLRRVTHGLGIAAFAAVGLALVLEATNAIGGRWRDETASAIIDGAFPSWGLWASALVGLALAAAGIALVAAQIAPPKKGLNSMHEVYKANDGQTRLRGRAAIAAVRHEVSRIDGVVEVDARVAKKRIDVEIQVDDRSDLANVETEIRGTLDHEFWINLGLADFALNLLITHHPKPPRVR